jgi:hypothetical protein
MKQLALTQLLSPSPEVDRTSAPIKVVDKIAGLIELRQIAWICVVCQFWVATICLGGSILLSESPAFTILCGLLACLSCTAPIIYVLYRKNFFALFSCVSIFNLAPIWFLYLEVILPGHDAYLYSRPMYKMEGLFWAASFQLFVNLVYLLLWRKATTISLNKFAFLTEIKLSSTFYFIVTIIVFAVPLIAFYFYYDSLEVLWQAITGGRSGGGSAGGLLIQEAVGNSSAFMLPFNWLWELTPLFGAIAFISATHKWRFSPVISLVLGLLVIFVFFLGGSRSTMVFVAAPVVFFFFYYNWDKGVKFWVLAGMLLFTVIGVMELQVRFRGNLLDVLADPAKAAYEQGLSSATTFDPTESHRDNNMYLFCLLVQGYPDRYAYEGYDGFFAVLANPIPRAIWPSKPIMNGAKDTSHQPLFVMDGPLLMGTTSLTYSIVGEAYQTDGMWGIIVYATVFALFMLSFDGITYYAKQRHVLSVGVLGISVFLAFWGYRGLFGLVSFLYPLLLLVLLLYTFKALKII